MKYGTLVLIILVLISCDTGTRELVYRPITLTVLDAETKLPLDGITIILVNYAFYSKPVWFSINHPGTIGRFVRYIYNYTTNENGLVEIPQFVYEVDKHHFLLDQKIILNIDLIDKSKNINEQAGTFDFVGLYTEDERDFFFRLNSEYKAGLIYCYTSSTAYKPWERAEPYITIIPKKYEIETGLEDGNAGLTSFHIDHEEFTFYLERFVEPE